MKISHDLGSASTLILAQYKGGKETLLNSYTKDRLSRLKEYSELFY